MSGTRKSLLRKLSIEKHSGGDTRGKQGVFSASLPFFKTRPGGRTAAVRGKMETLVPECQSAEAAPASKKVRKISAFENAGMKTGIISAAIP